MISGDVVIERKKRERMPPSSCFRLNKTGVEDEDAKKSPSPLPKGTFHGLEEENKTNGKFSPLKRATQSITKKDP